MPSHRCGRRTRSGGTCRQWPIAGGTVCRMHGGSAPQVKQAAEARIKALAEGRALARLEELLESPLDSVALAAAKDLLDRAGYAARQRVDVHHHQVQQEAERIAAKLGIPVEQVYREAGIQVPN